MELNPETLAGVVATAVPLSYLTLDYVASRPLRRLADSLSERDELIRANRDLFQRIGRIPYTIGPFTHFAKRNYTNLITSA